MTTTQNILRVGVIAQAGALAKSNLNALNKKKVKTKDILDTGIKNIVGINLLKVQSDIIAGL